LFTVTGVPKGTRVRLAAMDAYDGTVWNVAGGTDTSATSSGAFRRLGTGGAGVPVSVAVTGLGGVWVPDVAGVRSVQFTGPRAAELADSFRYNTATGTGIVPAGLQKGDGYTFRADVAAPPGSGSLSGRPAAAMVQPQPQDVPQVVTSVATDAAAKSKTAYARAQAIADKLRTTGYFSDGQANQAVSRAGHGAGRLADLFGSQVWIGDAEQYAAAAGLMARQLGLPTRVVMGFTVPASTGTGGAVVTGKQVTAWIEVAFLGSDWVPFDVTPDSSRVPPQQAPAPAPKPNPATQQPPPPLQQPPPPLPATGNDQGSRAGSASGFPAWLATVLTVAAWVSGPLLVAALVIAAIVGVKVRRRRRRRRLGSTDQRVAAGWWELLDAHRDHGAALPRSGTRREIAGAVGRPGTRELAEEADNAVFAGGTVTEDQATSFWSLVDRELADLASTGWRARWRARLSLRSLRRRTTT
jgi:transglutaminase-like putative cysteine protease